MLASIRFYIFLILTIITMPPMYLVSFIIRPWAVPIRGYWCRFQLFVIGIRFSVEGIPSNDTGIFIINHRSWLDILVLEAIVSKIKPELNLCWIGHSNLTKNPVVNLLFNLYENLTVERESKSGLVKLLRSVDKPISEHRPLMIFPEGTRNKNTGIGKFKVGAKFIAEKKSLEVQPIVLIGSDHFLDTRRLKINTGTLHAIFLEKVSKEDDNWLEKAHATMLNCYNSHGTY